MVFSNHIVWTHDIYVHHPLLRESIVNSVKVWPLVHKSCVHTIFTCIILLFGFYYKYRVCKRYLRASSFFWLLLQISCVHTIFTCIIFFVAFTTNIVCANDIYVHQPLFGRTHYWGGGWGAG